ncbi:iron-containing alcohol dehydrogenase [Maridesulfovibrio zosterae]|uniref:iron-containing alcohol dehydrogenase n=1 Tax=Maridesulfovibrio zosterae TaxID=82171 RepID=UPI00040FF9B6|nr:iron-containing alcohol dehydrogenase [Maridesulfovibrio zosterae]
MDNFIFHIPTKAYFGKGQIKNLGKAIKANGGAKVLLGYGGGSIKKNGIFAQIVDQLNAEGINYVEFKGIQPNPHIESVEQGMTLYHEEACDFILAVGGGSVIDTCKAVSIGVVYDGPVLDLLLGKEVPKQAAPLGSVLTMAGTGSEMDQAAVISVGKQHKKKALIHEKLFPRFSILDPEYTFTVPEYHSMAGCADILCHLMEQYFAPECGADVQDGMNEGLMRVVLERTPQILENPRDYNARASIMWASSMALTGFHLRLGKPTANSRLHMIGHELSSMYDMTHGVTLALLTPAWMRQTISKAPEYLPLFARFARNVMNIREANDAIAAKTGIEKLSQFYKRIGMPTNLSEAGVRENDLKIIANRAVENGQLGCLYAIGKNEVLSILQDAY